MSAHRCHARGCEKPCPPKFLMCRKHWHMVPETLRNAVWGTYQPGQESGRHRPSREWHDAADAAIEAVAKIEASQPSLPKQLELGK